MAAIYARPHSNGNTPDSFREAGRELNELAIALREKLVAIRAEQLHGRNYQHVEQDPPFPALSDRAKDLLRITSYIEATYAIEYAAIGLYQAGGG